MSEDVIFRILFVGHQKYYEIYARSVGESGMYGFVEVEQMILQPALVSDEPQKLNAYRELQQEFLSVKRIYIPLQSIYRIDELTQQIDLGGVFLLDEENDKKTLPAFVEGQEKYKEVSS